MVINNLQKHLYNPAFLEIQFSSRILNLETVLENEQMQKACERKKHNWKTEDWNIPTVIGWLMTQKQGLVLVWKVDKW